MSRRSILVSAVGGDIGVSVARAIRELDYKIIGCDMREVPLPTGVVDQFYRVAGATRVEDYFRALDKIIIKESVEFFIPVCEPEIKILNEHRQRMNALKVKILIHHEELLKYFLDKLNTIEYLKKNGVKVPKTSLLKDYNGSFGFPVIVKPRMGSGGKKNWMIEDLADLNYLRLKDDGSLIAQQYVGKEDEEYTTGIFSDGKKVSSITFKRRLGPGGLSFEVELVNESFLENLSRKIANSINLVGSINLQSRRIGKIFIPFEINPRLSSTLLFRKQFGFDDCIWWINVLSGGSYTYKRKYRYGRAIRYLSECYFDMSDDCK